MLYQASPSTGEPGGVEDVVANFPAGPVAPIEPLEPTGPVGPVAPTGAAPTSIQYPS